MSCDTPIRETFLPTAAREALQLLVAGAAGRAAPSLCRWIGLERLEHNLRGEAEGWLRRAADAELAGAYARHFPVPGTSPGEYRNRLFETDTGLRLLTGIRFRKLALASPFIELIWHDRPIRNPREFTGVMRAVLGAYAAFRPQHVSFFQAEPASAAWSELPGVTLQDRLVAAPVQRVAAATVAGGDCVRLEPARARAIYERYSAEYAALHATSPELRDAASVESLEALEAAQR